MRNAFWLILALPTLSFASNLTNYWATTGYKMARQDLWPNGGSGESSTYGPNWNGTTITLNGLKNETLGFGVYLLNGSGSNATNVSVILSSFTGPSGNSIVSISTPIADVWDTSGRPIQLFVMNYLPIHLESRLGWEDDFACPGCDERDLPPRFQAPCTTNGNGSCNLTSGKGWTDRPDHDKFYPDIAMPAEEYASSSFTVSASSSQLIRADVFVAKTLSTGTYTATFNVYEGVTLSTSILVSLTVGNATLPDTPSFPFIVVQDDANINGRHGNDSATTRSHYGQMYHAHGIIAIGDSCSADNPSTEYQARLSGSMFSSANGYGGRGASVGDPFYMLGTYGKCSWMGTDMCTHLSAWQTWFKTNYPSVASALYLNDESMTNVPAWSQLMSTAPACQVSGYKTRSVVTYDWPTVESNAPYLTMPIAGSFLGVSSATWQAAATHYETTGTTQAWAYNGGDPYSGSFMTDDSGTALMLKIWAYMKKGVQGGFYWDGNYYNNYQGGLGDTDLFNNAMTFGGAATSNSTLGLAGWNTSNGDGVLQYPGHNVLTSGDYGIDAPIASLRLKLLRRGIQDADYITMASAVNPAATAAIVNGIAVNVLWEHQCYDLGDCSYSFGGRNYSDDPNTYETARQSLASIITGATTPSSSVKSIQGNFTIPGFNGSLQ